ncbi:MAG: N-acyl-D-amino-acid deacylase family protein [Bacillota bacterium]
MYSVIIRGGKVFDGTGNPWRHADVGIQGDRIVAIGDLSAAKAEREIDARGMAVSPGFIDIHTHSDLPLLLDGRGQSHVQQGVTTNVIGNCGSGIAPTTEEILSGSDIAAALRESGIEPKWRTMGEYLDLLAERGVSINVAALVGQGQVRNAVMGFAEGPANEQQLDAMRDLVREAMASGAFGMSTGLIYTPSCYAEMPELVELAKVVAEHGGVYASHIRGENDTVLQAVAEAIEIGRQAGTPVQIAHLKAMGEHMWGTSVKILQMIDQARADGVDVTFDQYPYNASACGFSAVLPPWAHVGGTKALQQRLADPAIRQRLRQDIVSGVGTWTSIYKGVGWERIIITGCYFDHSLDGKSVAEIAELYGKDGFDTCFDLLMKADKRIDIVYFTIGDQDLERIMQHPLMMVGSDSSGVSIERATKRGQPHPRTFGTFVRVLGRYVREKGLFSWSEAIRKMTWAPAARLGLHDRGLLLPGMKADVVVFDQATVGDVATYTAPAQYAVGVQQVLVNGRVVVEHGQHTGVAAGEVLRHGK